MRIYIDSPTGGGKQPVVWKVVKRTSGKPKYVQRPTHCD